MYKEQEKLLWGQKSAIFLSKMLITMKRIYFTLRKYTYKERENNVHIILLLFLIVSFDPPHQTTIYSFLKISVLVRSIPEKIFTITYKL